MTLTAEQIQAAKGQGFLRDKNTEDKFNARVIIGNGRITAEQCHKIADAAERFGNGYMMMTRLCVELQGILFENIEPLRAFLQEAGLETGGTGAKVSPVVACKGTTCSFGIIDTFGLSEKIHERFYLGGREKKLPHKFKIAIGGCPNNCVKPTLNDFGIIGQRVPKPDYAKCRGCKVCAVEKACVHNVTSFGEDGKIKVAKRSCRNCGRCTKKCPFGVFDDYETGYAAYIGERRGRDGFVGHRLGKMLKSEDEVLNLLEKAIDYFAEHGESGERFAAAINRIGFKNVQNALIGK
jgi:dissimilatory sulfite reductase (desulfoviridin) alpha/beta subunit